MNTATLRLPPEAEARLDAWVRARKAHLAGTGPEALRCDLDGCPWPAGYCPSHPAQKAVA